jgi:hypothetical protein
LGPTASIAAEVPSDCSREKWISVADAREALSRRSVQIMDLAQDGDIGGLVPRVSPSAKFTLWEGDVGHGRKEGPDGAIEFASRLGASKYEYDTFIAAPLSTDVCGRQQVTVRFTPADGQRAFIVDFKYFKGSLVEAVAMTALVTTGWVGPM